MSRKWKRFWECKENWIIIAMFILGILYLALLCNSQVSFKELIEYRHISPAFQRAEARAIDFGISYEGASAYAALYDTQYLEYMREKRKYSDGLILNHPPEPITIQEFIVDRPEYARWGEAIVLLSPK